MALLLMLAPVAVESATIDDAEGDVVFGPAPDLTGTGRQVDIERLEIVENLALDAIDFRATMHQAPSSELVDSAQFPGHHVTFRLGVTPLEVRMELTSVGATLEGQWRLLEKDDLDTFFIKETVAQGDLAFLDDGRTVVASVPRLDLQPFAWVGPGMVFEQASLQSRQSVAGLCCGPEGEPLAPEYQDLAPDAQRVDVMLGYGAEFTEDLLLWSPSMIRFSNGGAMTIVFPMELTSRHEGVEIDVLEAPADWRVAIPIDHVDRPVESLIVPVIVSANFVHAHGKLDFMTLQATGGGERATAPVGIKFLDIPQPTGHHDTVWIHALRAESSSALDPVTAFHYLAMNAAKEDPRAQDAMVGAVRSNATGPGLGNPELAYERTWTWRVPLDPEMRLGIDPILDRQGDLAVEVESPVDADVQWDAWVDWNGQRFFEGRLDDALAVRGSNDVEITLHPTADARRSGNGGTVEMVLVIQAHASFDTPDPMNEDMALHGGGEMRLPLHEYSDSIVSVLPPSDIRFFVPARADTVPPATAFEQEIAVVNDGNRSQDVRFQVQGVEPVTMTVQPESMTVPAGGRADLTVRFDVPADAPRVTNNAVVAVTDTGHVAVLQWEIRLDDDAPAPLGMIPDDEGRDSPGPGLALLVLVIGIGIRTRR